MRRYEKMLAIALEAVGICVVAAGITVEVATGAGIGHIIITSGSLLAVFGAMLFVKIFRRGNL